MTGSALAGLQSAIDLRGARLGDGLRKKSCDWFEKTFEEVLVLRHVGTSLGSYRSARVSYRRVPSARFQRDERRGLSKFHPT